MANVIQLKLRDEPVRALRDLGAVLRLGTTIALEVDGRTIRAVVASIGSYPRSGWPDRIRLHEVDG